MTQVATGSARSERKNISDTPVRNDRKRKRSASPEELSDVIESPAKAKRVRKRHTSKQAVVQEYLNSHVCFCRELAADLLAVERSPPEKLARLGMKTILSTVTS